MLSHSRHGLESHIRLPLANNFQNISFEVIWGRGTVNENLQKSGIFYATTVEGAQLPIIDVTHTVFTVDDSPQAVEALRKLYIASESRWRPNFVGRFFMRLFAKKSLLLRSLVQPDAPFLSGLSTYVMKLGDENLVPPFNTELDRKVAASPPARAIRIRLQQTARMLADALEPEFGKAPGSPLDLINIGGGPAIDSVNALLLLQQRSPQLLLRPIVIHIFDLDTAGPAFGQQALAQLMTPGAPLSGLDLQISRASYNWNDAAPLRALVQQLRERQGIIAASSEGALFEYGNDGAVVANLKALREGGEALKVIAGSVTRSDDLTRKMYAHGAIKLVHRGLDRFADLAKQGGFDLVHSEPALTSDQVLLRPAPR